MSCFSLSFFVPVNLFILPCYRALAPERTLDDIFFTYSLCHTTSLWVLRVGVVRPPADMARQAYGVRP